MKRDAASPSQRGSTRRTGGPKTPAGKTHASRNAMRHGLAINIAAVPTWTKGREELARAIGGDNSDGQLFECAREIAEAQAEIERVRVVHESIVNDVAALVPPSEQFPEGKSASSAKEIGEWDAWSAEYADRLRSLIRYESRAVARRTKAIQRFRRLRGEFPT